VNLDRRHFITSLAATAGLAAIGGCAGNGASKRTIARVAVIGGGYSGATAAKYLRMWSPDIAVSRQ
jgi:phosphodiesterase/alkaline phosphatase D-like protein